MTTFNLNTNNKNIKFKLTKGTIANSLRYAFIQSNSSIPSSQNVKQDLFNKLNFSKIGEQAQKQAEAAIHGDPTMLAKLIKQQIETGKISNGYYSYTTIESKLKEHIVSASSHLFSHQAEIALDANIVPLLSSVDSIIDQMIESNLTLCEVTYASKIEKLRKLKSLTNAT